jgi:hypothetical protein
MEQDKKFILLDSAGMTYSQRKPLTHGTRVLAEVPMGSRILNVLDGIHVVVDNADDEDVVLAGGFVENQAGLCERTYSWSALLIRDCQPFPWDLKKSTTSEFSRMVSCFLVGSFCLPRLRRSTGLPLRYNCPSVKNSSGSSGSSVYSAGLIWWLSTFFKLLFKPALFSFIGFPHGNDPGCVTPPGVDHDDQPPGKFSHGDCFR